MTINKMKANDGVVLDSPLSWEADIRLLTNPLVRKQLLGVVVGAGLLMALILTIVFAAIGEFGEIPTMLLISLLTTIGLGLLLLLVSLLFFGNRIRVQFTISSEGVGWQVVDKRATWGNRLALLTGILSGNFQTAGAGLLAASSEKGFVQWRSLATVEFDQRHFMAILHGGWRPVMVLVCLPDNYEQVVSYVDQKMQTR